MRGKTFIFSANENMFTNRSTLKLTFTLVDDTIYGGEIAQKNILLKINAKSKNSILSEECADVQFRSNDGDFMANLSVAVSLERWVPLTAAPLNDSVKINFMNQNSNATSQTRRKRRKERACQATFMSDEPAKRNQDEHQKVNHFSESTNSQLLQTAIAKLIAGLALNDKIANPKRALAKTSPRRAAMTSYYSGHNVNLCESNMFHFK